MITAVQVRNLMKIHGFGTGWLGIFTNKLANGYSVKCYYEDGNADALLAELTKLGATVKIKRKGQGKLSYCDRDYATIYGSIVVKCEALK